MRLNVQEAQSTATNLWFRFLLENLDTFFITTNHKFNISTILLLGVWISFWGPCT